VRAKAVPSSLKGLAASIPLVRAVSMGNVATAMKRKTRVVPDNPGQSEALGLSCRMPFSPGFGATGECYTVRNRQLWPLHDAPDSWKEQNRNFGFAAVEA
jgi:hypothetical protein